MKRWLVLGLMLATALPSLASDFSGNISAVGGAQAMSRMDSVALGRIRVIGDWEKQWDPTWTSGVDVLGTWTASKKPFTAPSSDDGEENILDATWRHASPDDGVLETIRLQKAYVRYEDGRWQGSAGRTDLSWGEAHTLRPTAVFHAPRLLEAFGDPPMGSDGADASYAIGSNTNLEGAFRVQRGGHVEYVVRVENRGIGVSGTPLFVMREGENGLGLELSATLKHFQWRLEGMAWHFDDTDGRRMEIVTGFYGALHKFPVGVEWVRDGSGQLLGSGSSRPGEEANYFSAFMETPAVYRFRCNPMVLHSTQGGRLFVKPGLLFEATSQLHFTLDGRWMVGTSQGPLAAAPTQLEFSTVVLF
jgi:hypothetical protein